MAVPVPGKYVKSGSAEHLDELHSLRP
jgi:hypothetical protein